MGGGLSASILLKQTVRCVCYLAQSDTLVSFIVTGTHIYIQFNISVRLSSTQYLFCFQQEFIYIFS